MEKLADLPTPALITLGATLAVIFAVRYLGLLNGQKEGPPSAQVATMIVDPSALNKATAAVESLVQVLAAAQKEEKDHVHMICRRLENLTEEVKDMTRVLSDLRIEVAKRG